MSEQVTEPVEPAVEPVASDPVDKKTYVPPATQEDFDRIIQDRLARERKQYADYDELKAQQAEYEKWKESQLTEHEKAVKAARDEGAAEATTKFEKRIVTTEIRALATQAGFADASDALALFGDSLPVKDGEPDEAAITARLDEIAKSKPYLLKADTTPKPPKGRPKMPQTEKRDSKENGKGRAAAAIRQLGKQRAS